MDKFLNVSLYIYAINVGCVKKYFPRNRFLLNFNTVVFSPKSICIVDLKSGFLTMLNSATPVCMHTNMQHAMCKMKCNTYRLPCKFGFDEFSL